MNDSLNPSDSTPPKGTTPAAWAACGAIRSDNGWLIPERDENGNQIGQQIRYDDGRKIMVKGSKRGLTFDPDILAHAGATAEDPIVILEGATDQATGTMRGFTTIGRPSATGGGKLLVKLLKKQGKRIGRKPHVAIIGEHDDSGAGEAGADKIAAEITSVCATLKIIFPPAGVKDLNEWATGPAGADRDEIMAAISGASTYVSPTSGGDVRTWQSFPVDALPEALQRYVTTVSRAVGVEPCFVALPLMTMLASCIGTTRAVQLKRSWIESAILWSALVGESGTKKTPAMQAVLTSLRKLQRQQYDRHAKAMQEHERELAEYDRDFKNWKAKGEGDPPVKPEPPACVRHIASDTTTEALVPILLSNPRGILLVRDEVAGWLGDLDRYSATKGGDGPRWLSIWSAEAITVDRKSGGTTYVHRPAVSIFGGIQPGILKRVLGVEHREDGMFARFLVAMPPRQADTWTDDDVPVEIERELEQIVARLLELRHDHDEDGHEHPVLVKMNPEAKAAFIKWHDAHGIEQADVNSDLASAFSKMRGYVARMALVMHFSRWAAGENVADEIDVQSIESAIAIITFFKHEACRVYAMLDEGEDDREQRRLVEWISNRGGEVSVRDLTHSIRQYRGDQTAAKAALEALVEAGVGEWHYPNGPGRPSLKLRLLTDVTTVTVTETREDDSAGKGIGDDDEGGGDFVEV